MIISRRLFTNTRPVSLLLAGCCLAVCGSLPQRAAAQTMTHTIIPAPASVDLSADGRFVFTEDLRILYEPGNAEAAAVGRFLARLIGNTLETTPSVMPADGAPPEASILLTTAGSDAALGPEGYVLAATPERVTVTAPAGAGLFYGVQTMRQLLPPYVEYTAAFAYPLSIPTGRIEDRPRFAWRGAMLDVARHFLDAADVKRYIDLMALYKLNRLHLHLSDDQGWRIEIPSWPNLTTHGGSTEVGGGPGGYYTQEAFAGIVRYAQERFITVVPEIDVPGHTNAALASYAELNCDDVAPPLYTGTDVGFSSVCVEKEVVYRFLDDVIRDIAAVSPGPYFHVGGDEVQTLTEDQYRSFIERVLGLVQAHGKIPVGWDEIAEARVPEATLVQLWRPEGSQEAVAEAVTHGARAIISPANRSYLDMKYDARTILGLRWAGLVSVEHAYTWDPVEQVEGVGEADIEGIEAPIWAETLGTLDDFEFMAFPRLPGIAEIGWSPAGPRNWDAYRVRLGAQAPRWNALGVNYYRSPEVPWHEGPMGPRGQ